MTLPSFSSNRTCIEWRQSRVKFCYRVAETASRLRNILLFIYRRLVPTSHDKAKEQSALPNQHRAALSACPFLVSTVDTKPSLVLIVILACPSTHHRCLA